MGMLMAVNSTPNMTNYYLSFNYNRMAAQPKDDLVFLQYFSFSLFVFYNKNVFQKYLEICMSYLSLHNNITTNLAI